MPFATLGTPPVTGGAAIGGSLEALAREVGVRVTSILGELDALTERLADGQVVSAEEVLHAADRISALRTTIAYSAVLDGAA